MKDEIYRKALKEEQATIRKAADIRREAIAKAQAEYETTVNAAKAKFKETRKKSANYSSENG
jgi:hypothetical protein